MEVLCQVNHFMEMVDSLKVSICNTEVIFV